MDTKFINTKLIVIKITVFSAFEVGIPFSPGAPSRPGSPLGPGGPGLPTFDSNPMS